MVSSRSPEHSGDMTSVPPEAPPTAPDDGTGPRVTSQQMRDVTRLRRTVLTERRIAGVAGGLARHFDVDPLIVRVAFVVMALFGGSGVLLYGALWLLLPEDGAEGAAIRLDERSLTVALVGVGVVTGLALLGTWSDARWVSWPLAVVALIVLLVASTRSRPAADPPRPLGTYPPPGPGYPAATGDPMTTGDTLTTDPSLGSDTATAQLPPAPPYPPAGPTWSPAPPPPPLRDPRRRGPLLVWFTLALMALGVGVLGMFDVAGSDIPASAYPALATAIAGVMLLVGAFYGRAGGIIFLGLVSATALAAATIGERIETEHTTVRPTTSAQLVGTYSQGAGEIVYDLSSIQDLEGLDGRRLLVEQGAGRVEVILPRGIDVVATTSVGAGSAEVLGASREGLGLDFTERHDVADEPATLYLDVQLGLGEVDVHIGDTTFLQETR